MNRRRSLSSIHLWLDPRGARRWSWMSKRLSTVQEFDNFPKRQKKLTNVSFYFEVTPEINSESTFNSSLVPLNTPAGILP